MSASRCKARRTRSIPTGLFIMPDTSRPSGGTLKFTGHVQVITKSGFLAEPSVSTTDTATILLGAGAEYPQVETGPGHITLTRRSRGEYPGPQ